MTKLRTDLILLKQGDQLISYKPDRELYDMVFTIRRADGSITEERFSMTDAPSVLEDLAELIFADEIWAPLPWPPAEPRS